MSLERNSPRPAPSTLDVRRLHGEQRACVLFHLLVQPLVDHLQQAFERNIRERGDAQVGVLRGNRQVSARP